MFLPEHDVAECLDCGELSAGESAVGWARAHAEATEHTAKVTCLRVDVPLRDRLDEADDWP